MTKNTPYAGKPLIPFECFTRMMRLYFSTPDANVMKKWIVIALAAAALPAWYFGMAKKAQSEVNVASAAAEPETTLRIALEGKYPPFEYVNKDNQLVGFNIDLANALCQEMAVKCSINRYEWDDLIPAVQNNQADAIIATMSITDEREKLVQFTQPYARVPAAYMANKKELFLFPVVTQDRVEGKIIGVVEKTTFDDYLKTEFPSKVTIKRYADAEALLAGLQNNEINFAFGDSAVFGEFLRNPKHAEHYSYVGNVIKSDPRLGRGEAIAVAKGDTVMQAKFNLALDKLIKSGQYKEMQYKYFTLQIM
ncbi:transporter substrate-binding domain-containing protein [Deefgea chitinilytica]|uniref:Transporter substrate-binding domain-containing protein n=2 Tax=Chitinibacteraceae TaxID=2897177 RepID=A0ABS2CFH7_9NEIS|nr:transporter substrate-binding domain-containing protein [Deefgea chitinilytica]